MNNSIKNPKLIAAFFFLLFLISFAGCGKRSKTELTYRPPVAPLQFHCSRQSGGLWKIGGGAVTQAGIFGVEQTFDMRDEFTYLILRDRKEGTDQVFKIATKGYVELHTKGEHKLRVQREENKVVVDVETLAGSFDFKVFPDSEAVARVVLGRFQPDLVVFTDRRLAIEYGSIFQADEYLSLDAIQSVTYQKGFNTRTLIFNWKPGIQSQSHPFAVALAERGNADQHAQALRQALSEFAPEVSFNHSRDKMVATVLWAWFGLGGIAMVVSVLVMKLARDEKRTGKGCLGMLLFGGGLVVGATALIILMIDWETAINILA